MSRPSDANLKLYHKLPESLAQEFCAHASGKEHAPQSFVMARQRYFVDALSPEEVWILKKGAYGYSTIRCLPELELVRNLVSASLALGVLWQSDCRDQNRPGCDTRFVSMACISEPSDSDPTLYTSLLMRSNVWQGTT